VIESQLGLRLNLGSLLGGQVIQLARAGVLDVQKSRWWWWRWCRSRGGCGAGNIAIVGTLIAAQTVDRGS